MVLGRLFGRTMTLRSGRFVPGVRSEAAGRHPRRSHPSRVESSTSTAYRTGIGVVLALADLEAARK
jgi:hypothetical protein